MTKIKIDEKESVNKIASAMKNKEEFIISTIDESFNPLGYDKHSAEIWIASAGGGALMTIGGGALFLAFIDPEPTSKLGLLIGGGILMALTGGAIILTVLVTRAKYESVKKFNKTTGEWEWTLRPKTV